MLTDQSIFFQLFSTVVAIELTVIENHAESCIRAAGYSSKLEEGLSLNDSKTGSRIPRGCTRCKKDNRFIIRIHYKTGRTNSKIRSEMTKCFHPRLRRIESFVECPDCRRRSYSQGDYEHLRMPPIEI